MSLRNYLVTAIAVMTPVLSFGQDHDAQEFAERRARLFDVTNGGVVVILGNPSHLHTARFHQAPDFFYLTGISEPDGVLVMDGDDRSSTVFLRQLSAFEAMWNGPRLLNQPGAEDAYGIALKPLSELEPILRDILENEDSLYVHVQPRDQLQGAREEVRHAENTQDQHALIGGQRSEGEVAIQTLRVIQPAAQIIDVSSILDVMRWTKTPYEIERMREAGRIGAEGFVEAIRGTRPGVWEYELEAEARYVYQKNRAGDAFLPIVASGPNTMIIHYQENDRQTEPGDVVLMDYGAEFDGYTSDITRMWPVSGEFTEAQAKMYRCILDASKAMIAAIKPGIMESDLQDIAEEVYKKHGYHREFMQFGRYVGHAVGLSVHDPDPGAGPAPDVPFEVGTVFNVEPLLSLMDEGIHMRLEDTILVTEDGAENLTEVVPVDIDEIYRLVRNEE